MSNGTKLIGKLPEIFCNIISVVVMSYGTNLIGKLPKIFCNITSVEVMSNGTNLIVNCRISLSYHVSTYDK